MIEGKLTPAKSANHLNKMLSIFHAAHGGDRFPVDVDKLAFGTHEIFNWSDPITQIQKANIKNFEGMLASNHDQSEWMIVYSELLPSKGRIRFTKAHELGHYILHRRLRQEFMCSRDDMLNWSDQGDIEAEADTFASYFLMPLDDYRSQANGAISLDMFSHCANRYGVSLTAAILKWLSYTDEKAVLLMSNDGYINWASSSEPAFKSGAYLKTRDNVIPIPEGSLTANDGVSLHSEGVKVAANKWFSYSDSDADLTELKIYSEQYDSTLTLLLLPKYAEFWPPKDGATSS